MNTETLKMLKESLSKIEDAFQDFDACDFQVDPESVTLESFNWYPGQREPDYELTTDEATVERVDGDSADEYILINKHTFQTTFAEIEELVAKLEASAVVTIGDMVKEYMPSNIYNSLNLSSALSNRGYLSWDSASVCGKRCYEVVKLFKELMNFTDEDIHDTLWELCIKQMDIVCNG